MKHKEIEGVVANPGKFIGRVKQVTSPKDVNKVDNESVVVTNNNSPLFSIAFMRAPAIISEKGGKLCHLAIVSRELDKLCILDVENALDIFEEDMLVEVDASNNKIRILENE